jgi:hypothetical protein
MPDREVRSRSCGGLLDICLKDGLSQRLVAESHRSPALVLRLFGAFNVAHPNLRSGRWTTVIKPTHAY